MHEHVTYFENGDTREVFPLCSDACNREFAGAAYAGWNGCHENEHTDYCVACGVVLPGVEDACECQRDNVVVNRFRSLEGEKCEHGHWIQVPGAFLLA